MILAIDIGNTNIVFGVFKNQKLVSVAKFAVISFTPTKWLKTIGRISKHQLLMKYSMEI